MTNPEPSTAKTLVAICVVAETINVVMRYIEIKTLVFFKAQKKISYQPLLKYGGIYFCMNRNFRLSSPYSYDGCKAALAVIGRSMYSRSC